METAVWEEKAPVLCMVRDKKEVSWINPLLSKTESALADIRLSMSDVEDAEARLKRFAPFISRVFPETKERNGIIESPLKEIPGMKEELNRSWDAGLSGKLYLKMDSNLAVAGSVKARGGIYEILKYAEDLALEHGVIRPGDNYEKFAEPSGNSFPGIRCMWDLPVILVCPSGSSAPCWDSVCVSICPKMQSSGRKICSVPEA